MIVCPECKEPLKSGQCLTTSCEWQLKYVGDIPVYLSLKEYQTFGVDEYFANYKKLADKNLIESNIDPRYHTYQAENIVQYIGASNISGRRVCDIGSGQGQLSVEMLKAGAKSVTSIDIAPTYLANLPKESNLFPVLANAENLPFRNTFDIIVTTDVLEHVVQVSSFLYCLNRVARPGATVVIRVPYRENLIKYSKHIGFEYDFGHLRSFNRQLLREMLFGAGYKPVTWKLDGFGLGMPNDFWRRGSRKRWEVFEEIRRYLLRKLSDSTAVTKWHSSYSRILMKPNELVVIARKVAEVERISPKGFRLVPVSAESNVAESAGSLEDDLRKPAKFPA